MNARRATKRVRAGTRVVGAVLCLMLWLGLVAVTASPHLHEALHHDSHQASHDCVVTQLAKGQLLAAAGAVGVAAVALVVFSLPRVAPRLVPQPADVRLAASRAPPACSLLPL